MKLITRDTDYAVRALLRMAEKNGQIVSVGELVNDLRIPRPFLRKILQILNKKDFLESHKGLGGGFVLKVPVNEIYLSDVMQAFQGPFTINECLFKKRVCPEIRACMLKQKISEIEKSVVNQLKTITIGSLL